LAEKRIKGWVRAKKIALIEASNPLWLDLAEHLVSSDSAGVNKATAGHPEVPSLP
jgi:hypothetical protein